MAFSHVYHDLRGSVAKAGTQGQGYRPAEREASNYEQDWQHDPPTTYPSGRRQSCRDEASAHCEVDVKISIVLEITFRLEHSRIISLHLGLQTIDDTTSPLASHRTSMSPKFSFSEENQAAQDLDPGPLHALGKHGAFKHLVGL